jgi:hypothetical protein
VADMSQNAAYTPYALPWGLSQSRLIF